MSISLSSSLCTFDVNKTFNTLFTQLSVLYCAVSLSLCHSFTHIVLSYASLIQAARVDVNSQKVDTIDLFSPECLYNRKTKKIKFKTDPIVLRRFHIPVDSHFKSMDDSSRGINRYGEKEKIPRPRNAFILFRQHNHKLLIDEWTTKGVEIPHNSKISKLLGVKWKELSAEEKVHWKELAEKEKTDHEKKYPDYRYKPVRKQRKKREPVSLEIPPRPHQHPPISNRPPPQGLLPFNNYTRPLVSEPPLADKDVATTGVGNAAGLYRSPFYLPKAAGAPAAPPQMQPYYMQQPYPYNYYGKTQTAPVNQPVYAPPIPLQMQMQMQMQVQQRNPSHEQQVPDFPYHQGYQHQQHRLWSPQQPANPKLHPIMSSNSPAPVFHEYPHNVNHQSPNNPRQDSNSH